MKGETGATLLSRPWAALPGFIQQPQARQRWPPSREPFPLPLSKQNFSVFGEYFRNSDEKDWLLLSAPGAERGLLSSSVGETMGTPERSAFLRMTGPPRTAAPHPCRAVRCPAAPAWRPVGCGDCHQLRLPLRKDCSCIWVCLQQFVDSGVFWSGVDLVWGVCWGFFFFYDNEVTL